MVGPPLLLAPAQVEEWALWLETGPDIWTTDPSRAVARRALAQSLRQGAAVGHLKTLIRAGEVEVKVSFPTLQDGDWQSQIPYLPGSKIVV